MGCKAERHERHADEHLIGGVVIEPDLTILTRRLRWPGVPFSSLPVSGAGSGVCLDPVRTLAS